MAQISSDEPQLHTWIFTAFGPHANVETCEKCGLLRIATLNGEFFFTRLDRQFAQCPMPWRKAAEAAQQRTAQQRVR